MFRRFFDEGLAQNSYLIACERTRQAAIVDPRRDVDDYAAAARELGLSITHAIDTHIHADFVSGSRELGALGAEVVAGPGAGLGFAHREVADGTVLTLGDVTLTCRHTPGHTPEHITVISRHPGEPVRAFTGDTLFVGAVGRPDLLGDRVMRELAGALHHSLFDTLLALPDDVEVHPGHGAGSLCGAGIGKASHSTIGQERRANPLLQFTDRDAFVAAVLADLPETPPYFPLMKRVNHDGAPLLGLARGIEPPPVVSAATAAAAMEAGAWLIDLRPAAVHGAGHPRHSVNIGFGPKAGFWAAWVIPPDARILLMLDGGPSHAADVRRQLLRVGLDNVSGWIDGGFAAWRDAGLPSARIDEIAAADVRQSLGRPDAVTIVDVRSEREWRAGHIAGAVHIPLHELARRAGEIPRRGMVAALCEGGYRSSIAASLLERAGLPRVANVTGGMTAWRALEASTR